MSTVPILPSEVPTKLPRDSSESLGEAPAPPLVLWEMGKVTDFPFPYPSGWLPTSQACCV
ncbi:hypothetical protein ACRRTK_016329 [Alexandromys fortis]